MNKVNAKSYLSVRYNEYEDRYYADLYVDTKCVYGKYLTQDEGESLQTWLQRLHDDSSYETVDISCAEILEHYDNGEIHIGDESLLLEEMTKHTEHCQACGLWGDNAEAWAGLCHDCDNQVCPTCGLLECDHEF